jgi:hypothetical protein
MVAVNRLVTQVTAHVESDPTPVAQRRVTQVVVMVEHGPPYHPYTYLPQPIEQPWSPAYIAEAFGPDPRASYHGIHSRVIRVGQVVHLDVMRR